MSINRELGYNEGLADARLVVEAEASRIGWKLQNAGRALNSSGAIGALFRIYEELRSLQTEEP